MTRILVVWEDACWQPLGLIVKRLVRTLAPAPDADIPRVLSHTSRGNSTFDRYAHTTWPAVRAAGLPTDAGPLDHLVCVVDADRLHDLVPTAVPPPPAAVAAIADWHAKAERTWTQRLRAHGDPSGPPATTVHGLVLRWNKESLLLAGYDQPAMATLDIDSGHTDVKAALAKCAPRPSSVEDGRFTDTYRRPSSCLKLLRDAAKLGALHKSAPEIDDALQALARESLSQIQVRVPDIGRLAALVWRLHDGPLAPPPTPIPAGSKTGKKKAR